MENISKLIEDERKGNAGRLDWNTIGEHPVHEHQHMMHGAISTINRLLDVLQESNDFVARCHELGAVDTDIVKHALESEEMVRELSERLDWEKQVREALIPYQDKVVAVRTIIRQAEQAAGTELSKAIIKDIREAIDGRSNDSAQAQVQEPQQQD